MSRETSEQALPGFEGTLEPPEMADVGADLRDQTYTGERLRKSHPGKYALAVRAFFERGRSAESICDILKIDKETLRAVVEQESIARGVFEPKRRIRAKATSVMAKMLDKLEQLLGDEEAVERAGIFGITKAIEALNRSQSAQEGETTAEDGKSPVNEKPNEYEEIIEAEWTENGFEQKKSPARENGIDNETRASVREERNDETPGSQSQGRSQTERTETFGRMATEENTCIEYNEGVVNKEVDRNVDKSVDKNKQRIELRESRGLASGQVGEDVIGTTHPRGGGGGGHPSNHGG